VKAVPILRQRCPRCLGGPVSAGRTPVKTWERQAVREPSRTGALPRYNGPMRVRDALGGTLLALLLVAPPLASAEEAPDGLRLPEGPRRSTAFLKAVNFAIERGVAWLRRRQQPDGSFPLNRRIEMFHVGGPGGLGPTALGLYTLRACGASFDNPDVKRGFQRLREIYDRDRKVRNGLDNYGVSLTLLALEAHYHAEEGPPEEGNRYGAGLAGSRRIPEPDLDWIRELARWLAAAQTGDGAFSYWSPAGNDRTYDHSNSQYSLLALKAASRCGVEIPDALWRKSLDHFLATQDRKGPAVGRFESAGVDEDGYGISGTREVAKDFARGWGYRDRNLATGSMTAGGVSSLVICRSELVGTKLYNDRFDRTVVQAIRDGIAWLGASFSVEKNPGPVGAPALRELWHYYFLYGLERAGVMSGVVYMAEHDWYFEGARFLLDSVRDDGSWLGQEALDAVPWPGAGPDGASANYLDTCFALLFLKRATFRIRRGAVATAAGTERLDLDGAADLDEASFGAVFEAVFLRFSGADGAGREVRAGDFVRLGNRALPLLILRLESDAEPERAAAADALRRTVGETRGFRADAPPEERTTAVAAWEAWWFRRRADVAPDLKAGRFVDLGADPK